MHEHEHIETFFTDLRDTHVSGVGVKETSYYPYLVNLLSSMGKRLKPRVRCIIHPHSIGAGLPDGALITTDQTSQADDPLAEGLIPARGVIEVKSPRDDAQDTANSEQVEKYVNKYGLVLVTNLRQFIIVARVGGQIRQLETFTVATSENSFWRAVTHPRKLTESLGASFHEYLARVLLQAAPLTSPKEVAWFLASYARDAKARIESKADLPGLSSLRTSLEEALGLKFTGQEGEHFFRSSLVQTLFYGVFSAWVLWCKRASTGLKDEFNWHEAAWSLHVPMIRTLFEQLATPSKLQALGLEEVLDWTQTALNRVDRGAFFVNFEEHHAVQYFYEPFLAAYDPVLRKRLGVWFTPPEIVRYIVARIDRVLRDHLDVADGLANSNVFVLDPCCGTGAFLVEVLRQIEATLKAAGGDALTAEDVKTAAMERVFGFELLPAPFVVSHLQLGLLLHTMGAPLSEKLHERVGVYLTNALTGWNPPEGPKQTIIPELEDERNAADLVKRDKTILVVLGNPPYYAFAGVSPDEEQGLVDPYKEGLLSEWKIRKYNLDELYVRFLRLAERRIAEMTGRGIVCYISNYSYLSDPSFVVVRKRFCREFDYVWIDCLNGDSRETGKLTPDGQPDPSVFSTEYNREGIRLGTSIGLFAKTGGAKPQAVVRYREFWGADKRALLLKTLDQKGDFDAQYETVAPAAENRFSFRPSKSEVRYGEWPAIVELPEEAPISGLQEMRRGALMAHEREPLKELMQRYFDAKIDWATFAQDGMGLARPAGGFDPSTTRDSLRRSESYDHAGLRRYALYPLDNRWCYYSRVPHLWNRARPELLAQRAEGESFFIVRRFAERPKEGSPAFFTSALPDYHLLRPNAVAIPLRLSSAPAEVSPQSTGQGSIFEHLHDPKHTSANLSEAARSYLAALTKLNPDEDAELSRAVWFHALAILYTPQYLAEHAASVRADWPHIPLPESLAALRYSAQLGASLAQLLDVEQSVLGVTYGKLRKELSTLGRIAGPKGLSLEISAGWGHAHKEKQIVMPGRGFEKKRGLTADEKAALEEGATELGISADEVLVLWGGSTLDIYLNDKTYWSNVPEAVWEYTIGGYQVLKKWLSYREREVLGRGISKEEAREFTQIVRRIAAVTLLEPELDKNYLAAKTNSYRWPKAPS